jgi:hypothetical protein
MSNLYYEEIVIKVVSETFGGTINPQIFGVYAENL